jgi:hypothetical protein
MVKNRFYITNLKFNLIILGYKRQILAYSFPSKASREVSPLIVFLLDIRIFTTKLLDGVVVNKSRKTTIELVSKLNGPTMKKYG